MGSCLGHPFSGLTQSSRQVLTQPGRGSEQRSFALTAAEKHPKLFVLLNRPSAPPHWALWAGVLVGFGFFKIQVQANVSVCLRGKFCALTSLFPSCEVQTN